jgi:peroxiredoxin
MELTQYQGLPLGSAAPDFSLPGVDGKTYSLSAFKDKPILVVAFWCNHCPYVQAWEDRTVAVQKDFAGKGVQFVAINANDEESYPEDDFAHMVERSKRKGYNFPYLRDESQKSAEAYGAVCTPDFFVFDSTRKLRYRGKLDDSKDPKDVKKQVMREVLDALASRKDPPVAFVPPMGCSIKWKAGHWG